LACRAGPLQALLDELAIKPEQVTDVVLVRDIAKKEDFPFYTLHVSHPLLWFGVKGGEGQVISSRLHI
jgi:hypothetical protein